MQKFLIKTDGFFIKKMANFPVEISLNFNSKLHRVKLQKKY